MKRLELSIVLSLLAAPLAPAATDTFNNNGVFSYVFPPSPAPQIDARNFVNRGYFAVTNIWPTSLFAPSLPYETYNTLNYTNYNLMLGDSGFRFDFFNSATSRRSPAANFMNGVSVADENATVFGSTYLHVLATNIVNRGILAVGGPGLMTLKGDNVNLVRGRLSAAGNDTNGVAGILDRYWGYATNQLFANFNPSEINVSMIVETIQGQLYQNIFQNIRLTNGYTAHVLINQISPTFQAVDVLFLANTNPAITTEVRFGNGIFGSVSKAVQWTAILTNRATGSLTTNRLYLLDSGTPQPIFQIFNPARFFGFLTAQTYRPFNYDIFRVYPFFTNLTEMPPVQFDPFLFAGTNFPIIAENSGYGADVTAEGFRPDPFISGSTFSNVPGRIEIIANKVLDLTRARIDGQSYLRLIATNHFVGSTNAEIISPVSFIDLATTNSTMQVANLLTPSVPRIDGLIDVWTGQWTNSTDQGVTSLYSVTVVDSRVDAELPSQIQDLKLRADNLVVSDVLNVFQSMLVDCQNLTITSNAPGSPTVTGEINLTSGDLFWSASFPRLQNLTNYGRITSANTIYFGGARRQPWYTGTFDEAYQSFINHGTVISQGNDTWANYYVSSGTNHSGVGPLSVQAGAAFITNGSFTAPSSEITITANSLLVSNQVLTAGRSLNLSVTGILDDGSLGQPVALITNRNTWQVGDGIRLMTPVAQASLLGTTITNVAYNNADVRNYWAAADRGCTANGFVNNAAIGRLILDARTNAVFTFSPVNGNNAIYVDYLELRNFANLRDADGNFVALKIDPGMKIYFAQAVAEDGTVIAEKLDGRNEGGLCWVSGYHSGFFSSTNVFNPETGATNSVNLALTQSCDIDSDNDGIVNCLDATPVAAGDLEPQDPGTGGNPPPGNGDDGVTETVAQLEFPGGLAPMGTRYQTFGQVNGTYRGLFYDTNEVCTGSSGYVIVATTGPAYSARIRMGTKDYVFSGRFNTFGVASKTVARSGLTPLTVKLQLDMAGGNRVVGIVSSAGWSSTLLANRAVYNSLYRPFPNRGKFNVVIPPAEAAGANPKGFSYGAAKVAASGSVVWSGTLSDTIKVTQETVVSRQGVWPLYAAPASGRGLVIGWVQVNQTDLGGEIIWIKPAGASVKYYPGGFTNVTEMVGARYVAPKPRTRALPLTEGVGQLIFSGDCLSAPITNNIYLNNNNQITSSGAPLTIGVDKLTGSFWGSVQNPETGKPLPFQGRMLQQNNFGAGFAWTTNRCGSVFLVPAP
ncbi:MAG TPA: hypothetical protein VN673_12565 [Clostridia bacterium]|nr:hypothetical protein [Clostridia bacterium]